MRTLLNKFALNGALLGAVILAPMLAGPTFKSF